MQDRHDVTVHAPVPKLVATAPLMRRHVLESERQSERQVFGDELSPVEIEIEHVLDDSLRQGAPGWITRSL